MRNTESRSPVLINPAAACGRGVILALACLAFRGTPATAEPHAYRFIYNSDAGNMFIDRKPPMTPAEVHAYVDEVAGTSVTTLFMCPNFGMDMNYPGQAGPLIGSHASPEVDKRIRERGPLDKGSLERGVTNLRALVAAGHDPLGLVIDRARARKLEVFITFRLNEIHNVYDSDSVLLSEFWLEHPGWRVGKLGDEVDAVHLDVIGGNERWGVSPVVATWFPGALNFAVPEVREHRLAQLRECCERYPIDGLDLDFQRFPIFFPQGTGPEHVDTMTAWVRQVREMTREIGRKRNRPLLLSTRVMAKPEQCLAIGLDPATWAREGLIDFVVISHYLRNDFPLPVSRYRGLLPHIPLYASIEVEREADGYRRIARRLWSDGVDGIQLFNFFTWREPGVAGREPPLELLNELGRPARTRPAAR